MITENRDDREIVQHLIAGELGQSVLEEAQLAAQDIVFGHGKTVAAVLFYGSCLQQQSVKDKVLDFYVLVDSCAEANGSKWMGFWNEAIPPNVFYRELDVSGATIRSKYAIMSVASFEEVMRPDHLNSSFWARFAQPCALAYCRDDDARERVVGAVSQAIITFARAVMPTFTMHVTSERMWSRGFEMTYNAELRAEDAKSRGRQIYMQSPERYDALMLPALTAAGMHPIPGDSGRLLPISSPSRRRVSKFVWWLRRVNGKTLSLLRLVKGAFTFTGAIDYLAWKISRHSGVTIEIKDWHRRHPLIGGLSLFLKTRVKGGFR